MRLSRFIVVMFASLVVPLVLANSSSAQTLTTLAYFTDGTTVDSYLIQGRDGNFYGTSNNGGAGGYGTVFQVTPSGTLTTLHTFCSQTNCADGFDPYAGLALGNGWKSLWDGSERRSQRCWRRLQDHAWRGVYGAA